MSRVRIGTCAGPADAALIRAMFSARGIPVVVGAEHHSSMLGGLGGSFLSLDIWVAEEDSEDAIALLQDLREPGDARDLGVDDESGQTEGTDGTSETNDAASDHSAEDADAAADGDFPEDDAPQDDASDPLVDPFHARIARRRRTAIALLLGCCVTFGTAHMYTRAWVRGIALAAIEIAGGLALLSGHDLGGIAAAGAVAVDVVGAVWRVWSSGPPARPRPALPEARVHRG